jgi:hypothetical protein
VNDAIRLSVKFLTEIKGFEKDEKGFVKADNNYKSVTMKSFEKFIVGGTSADEITKWMDTYKKVHPSPNEVYRIEDIVEYLHVNANKGIVKQDPDNLIESGRFYYHPALQVAPPPPVIEILPDGTFKSSYEEETEFYLEIKDRFTLDDLVDYFYRKADIQKQRNRNADKGAFKHMLKDIDLDLLLYAVEEAVTDYDDMPKVAFDVQPYLEDAELVLADRKNTCYEVGLSHVIPRS